MYIVETYFLPDEFCTKKNFSAFNNASIILNYQSKIIKFILK